MSLGGLFTHRSHNQGRSFATWRARETVRKLDAFAEMLANEIKPSEAAVRLGHTPPYGRVLLQRIIKRLGKEQCQ